MPVPLIAAGIGAVGSISGSALSGSAAKSAADTQAAAANKASANALAQYQTTRADLAPYRDIGSGAGNLLSAILGLAPKPTGAAYPGQYDNATIAQVHDDAGNLVWAVVDPSTGQPIGPTASPGQTQDQFKAQLQYQAPQQPPGPDNALLSQYGLPGLTFQPTQAQLEATPGYQFDLSQGLLGVANSNAAKGLSISGPALKGAAAYATGLANNTLTTQQGIFQQNLANVLNPLMWATNLGQSSAVQGGQQGVQAVGNANQLAVGGANALAAGQVGSANALASGLNGLGNSATNYLLYSQLMNNNNNNVGMLGNGGFGAYGSGNTYG